MRARAIALGVAYVDGVTQSVARHNAANVLIFLQPSFAESDSLSDVIGNADMAHHIVQAVGAAIAQQEYRISLRQPFNAFYDAVVGRSAKTGHHLDFELLELRHKLLGRHLRIGSGYAKVDVEKWLSHQTNQVTSVNLALNAESTETLNPDFAIRVDSIPESAIHIENQGIGLRPINISIDYIHYSFLSKASPMFAIFFTVS